MKKSFKILIIALFLVQIVSCQNPGATSKIIILNSTNRNRIKPINLIDNPTANSISARESQVKLRLYHDGGMLGGLSARLSEQLQFGITYGGQDIIGQGKVTMNKAPGVNIRYRLKPMQRSGDVFWPEIAIGFNSQGYGTYIDSLDRYQIKSKGFYTVASGYVTGNRTGYPGFGYHGGINFSMEDRDVENDINFFCGAHLNIDNHITLVWEYDFGINDNNDQSLGSGKGYMNAALRWYFSPAFALEFSAKNLLNNNRVLNGNKIPNANRELKIIYFQSLDFWENSR